MAPVSHDPLDYVPYEAYRDIKAQRDRALAMAVGYRDALTQIMVRCQQGNEPQAAMVRAHHVARRALAEAHNGE